MVPCIVTAWNFVAKTLFFPSNDKSTNYARHDPLYFSSYCLPADRSKEETDTIDSGLIILLSAKKNLLELYPIKEIDARILGSFRGDDSLCSGFRDSARRATGCPYVFPINPCWHIGNLAVYLNI